MTSSSLPHLPAELWAQVLQNVDDPFMLWVTCRQVSRAWRKEGERAFRATYLPILHIEWIRVVYGRVAHTIIAITDEQSIDPTSSTLSFVLRWGAPESESITPDHVEDFTREEWETEALNLTRYDDYRLWVNGRRGEINQQAIWFDTADGRYTFVGSAETRAFSPHVLDQDQEGSLRRKVDCDWKALMDALFVEEIYVRRRNPGPSFYELGEQGIRDMLAGKKHQVTPGKFLTEKFKPLYAAAFQERLRRTFSRQGVDLYTHDSFTSICNFNQQLDYHIEKTGCEWMMECRLERLQAFAGGILETKSGE